MKNIFAVIGMFGIVVLITACGVVALWVGNVLLDVNRAPVILDTAVSTIEAAGSANNTVRLVDVQDAPGTSGGGVVEAVVVETAVPAVVATQPAPTPTAEFAPTPEYSPGFLANCAGAMARGERVSPRCPTNAAEMLGTGR